MGKILDFIKEHKIIAAVSGLVLVLLILILILMLMSGGKTSLAGNPDSRYPYTISVTAKGLELTVRGDFPKGYSWEGESENGNIILSWKEKEVPGEGFASVDETKIFSLKTFGYDHLFELMGVVPQIPEELVKENFDNVNNYQLKISNYFSAGSFGSTQTVRLFVKITMPGFAPFGFFT